MITLTAEIEIKGEKTQPLVLGEGRIGQFFFGNEVSQNLEIKKNNSISIDFEKLSRQNDYLPSWGIVSNSGRISFRDNGKKILGYINSRIIKRGKKVKIFLKNTISKKERQVGHFYVSDFNYDEYSLSAQMDLTDGLLEWQEQQIDPLVFDVHSGTANSFKSIYKYLYGQIPSSSKVRMKSFDELDNETKAFLGKNFVKFPFIDTCSLWSAFDSFAKATQTYIFVGKDGVVDCKYFGGN